MGKASTIRNRKARHDYDIEDTLEAGIKLVGTEVKSLREGNASLRDAFCGEEGGEMYLFNAHIAPYQQADEHLNHDPRRDRKLLMHNYEIRRWARAAKEPGVTIVPLKIYFRDGYAKVKIGLAKGRKKHDKRAAIKEKEEKRRMKKIEHKYR